MADQLAQRLDRIETEISRHRSLYLQATWNGRLGEADAETTEIDRLLGLWQQVRDQHGAMTTA